MIKSIALVLVTVSLSTACTGGPINWPKALQCGVAVSEAELHAVERILAGDGDTELELASLAEQYAAGTVECAVQSVIDDLSSRKGGAEGDHSLARGRAFLAKHVVTK